MSRYRPPAELIELVVIREYERVEGLEVESWRAAPRADVESGTPE
jgi:hypothetical protein